MDVKPYRCDPFGVVGALMNANRGRCPRLLECNASGVEAIFRLHHRPGAGRPHHNSAYNFEEAPLHRRCKTSVAGGNAPGSRIKNAIDDPEGVKPLS